MKNNLKIAVIGAGSWGTALAVLLAGKGYTVDLWGHRSEHIDALTCDRENKKYLPDITFPAMLQVVHHLKKAVESAAIIIMAVPSHSYRQVFNEMVPFLAVKCSIVSAVKGIENTTLMTMTQVMAQVLTENNLVEKNIELGVISGPSFAKEVAQKVPTAVTIGFENLQTAKEIQKIFVTEFFQGLRQ